MSLFEFLMILLSIIVGLGISELLTGFARILRAGRLSELCLAHGALLILAATMGVLFKTLAFGAPLFIVDNITSFPTIGILAALAWSKSRWLHNILVPTCLVLLVLDTVTISYEIR